MKTQYEHDARQNGAVAPIEDARQADRAHGKRFTAQSGMRVRTQVCAGDRKALLGCLKDCPAKAGVDCLEKCNPCLLYPDKCPQWK